MLFSVFTLDNPNATDKRKAVHGAHVAHLKNAKSFGVTITVGGPLVSDDGATSIGSLMVLETSDCASAESSTVPTHPIRTVSGKRLRFGNSAARNS